MSELVITRGLPGSGKTTWAEFWVMEAPAIRRRVNRDSLRRMIHIDAQATTQDTEATITKIAADLVRTFLRAGLDVVVDDTNLRQRTARAWATLASVVGAELKVKDFTDVPLATCVERNAARNGDARVPDGVIETMHAKYIAAGNLTYPEPSLETSRGWLPWEPTTGLKSVYLVDIDGTVAIKGERDIYDGSKAHLDTPNWDVVRIVRGLQKTHPIIYMTGRDAEHRSVTAGWLAANGLIAHELHTRRQGDKRKDSIVKHELFNTHIRGKYNVAGVFDDRNQVVEMWRAVGLTVFQVADGNF